MFGYSWRMSTLHRTTPKMSYLMLKHIYHSLSCVFRALNHSVEFLFWNSTEQNNTVIFQDFSLNGLKDWNWIWRDCRQAVFHLLSAATVMESWWSWGLFLKKKKEQVLMKHRGAPRGIKQAISLDELRCEMCTFWYLRTHWHLLCWGWMSFSDMAHQKHSPLGCSTVEIVLLPCMWPPGRVNPCEWAEASMQGDEIPLQLRDRKPTRSPALCSDVTIEKYKTWSSGEEHISWWVVFGGQSHIQQPFVELILIGYCTMHEAIKALPDNRSQCINLTTVLVLGGNSAVVICLKV